MNNTMVWNHKTIIPILHTAGKQALHAIDSLRVTEKDDRTLVTNIDIAIEQYICHATTSIAPTSYHIGEESIRQQNDTYIASALRSDCWIIDPIDGTMPYACGLPTWGISLAYARNGVITDGALFLPYFGTLIITIDGSACVAEYGCDAARWEQNIDAQMRPLTITPYRAEHRGIISISQDTAKYGRLLNIDGIQSVGSCVYSVVQFILGHYKGMLTNVKLWDIAAAIPLLTACGAVIIGPNKKPITPLIAAMPFEYDNSNNNLFGMHGQIIIAPTEAECLRLMDESSVDYPQDM